MKNFLYKNFWIIALHLVVLTTVIANFPIGKYFIGWDSLMPELNIPLNISRSISSFWQENYGLGALTGHGFAATLPHTLIIGLFSLLLPQWSLRFAFTFLCYYLGGIGMYFLIHYLLGKLDKLKSLSVKPVIPIISFIGALYYLFNLGTTQVFFIQLEAFIVQYAAFPWLFLSAFLVLDKGRKRDYILFIIATLFASIQGFIPSLFASYFVSLLILVSAYFVTNRTKKAFKKAVGVIGVTLFVNAYWILPVVYFQLTRGSFFLSAYNNLTSTPNFIKLSTQYGNLSNVALLKSYLFNSYELGGYVLQPLITHLNFFAILLIGYAIFGLIVAGIILSLLKLKSYYTYVFSLSFLYFFTSLAINTFPFNLITKLLQVISPTYEQAFRTTFTKFGIGMSFLYSVELCFALFLLAYLAVKFRKTLIFYISSVLLIFAILLYALPVFNGHLLYKKLQLNVPSAYFDFMHYMNSKPDARIADFPQYCSDGWYAYNWGYFGSGFLWYGVKQPFLSRSFDVWSNNNENYYWELSQALNQRDYEKVNIILNKYNVNWVLFDPNEVSCATQKGIINNNELLTYLEKNKGYVKEATFTKDVNYPITLLKNPNSNASSFISAENNVPNIGPKSEWIDSDIASDTYYTSRNQNYDYYYPFRSLLTKRGKNKGSEPKISVTDDTISFTTKLPALKNFNLNPLPYNSFEKIVPVSFFMEPGEDSSVLSLQFIMPEIILGNTVVSAPIQKLQLGSISNSQLVNSQVLINGQIINGSNNLYKGMFSTDKNNTVEIVSDGQIAFSWSSQSDPAFENQITSRLEKIINITHNQSISINIPTVADNVYFGVNKIDMRDIHPEACYAKKATNRNIFEVNSEPDNQYIRLISQDNSQCIKLHFPQLVTSQSYLMSIRTENIRGNLPKTSLYNNGSLIYSDIATGSKHKNTTSYYIIPPSSPSEVGYNLEFENSSSSEEKSINNFYSVSLYPIPYNFIKNINLKSNQLQTIAVENVNGITVQHPNPTKYIVELNNRPQIITLSQSYDKGWSAYEIPKKELGWKEVTFPFLFGKKLGNHILVNNWENGWILDNSIVNRQSSIVIVYVPQYLEYLGFLLLFMLPLLLLLKRIKPLFSRFNTNTNSYFDMKTDQIKEKIAQSLSK